MKHKTTYLIKIILLFLLSSPEILSQSIQGPPAPYCTGKTIALSYTGSCPSGTITWSYSGGLNPSGATISGASATLSYSSAGSATVNATCSTGGNASTTLTIQTGNAPVAVSITANQNNICSGTSVTFTASSATGGTYASFGWFKNGASVAGGYGNSDGTATYTTTTLGNNDQMYASMTPDYTKCPANMTPVNSNTVSMVVNQKVPAISIATATPVNCQGSSGTTFTPSVNGSNLSPSYQWRIDGNLSGTSSGAYTTSALTAGIHTITGTVVPGNTCYLSAISNALVVTLLGSPVIASVITIAGSGSVVIPQAVSPWTAQWADNPVPTAGESVQWKNTNSFSSEGPYPPKYISYVNPAIPCETTPRNQVNITVYKSVPNPGSITGNPGPITNGSYTYSATHTISGYNYQWSVSPGLSIVSGQNTPVITVQVTTTTGSDYVSVQASTVWATGATYTMPLFVADVSYVRDETILIPGITAPGMIFNLPVASRQSQTTYLDGLGRTIQHVAWQQSPQKKDMVQTTAYDGHNLQPVSYLPYTDPSTTDGNYKITWATDQPQFYQGTSRVAQDSKPTALTIFEPSPLNRVAEQGAAGLAWQPAGQGTTTTGNTIKTSYAGNGNSEVFLWQYDYSTGLCANTGYYQPTTLYKTGSTDEHGNQSFTYTDRTGHTIYTKTQDNLTATGSYLETYSIYDDFGALRIVIPPMGVKTLQDAGSWTITQSFLDTWCYQYKYDSQQRKSQVKIPGAAWVYLVYDNRDRPVLSQDGNQRSANNWNFTKYDMLNRPVATGILTYPTTITQAQMQTVVDGVYGTRSYFVNLSGDSYSDESFPNSTDGTLNYLTQTYYDNYNFKSTWNNTGNAYDFVSELGISSNWTRVFGKATGVKVKVLNDGTWLKTVSYYDDRGRVIQTISDNYTATGTGGIDRTTSQYDFAGRVLQTKLTHTGIQNLTVAQTNSYDHASRLTDVYHAVNGGQQIHLAHYLYNELGQLVEKQIQLPPTACIGNTVTVSSFNSNCTAYIETQLVMLAPGFSFAATAPGQSFSATIGTVGPNTGPLQSVDYRYNIRGWLTSINNSGLSNDGDVTNDDSNDLWGMEIRYNTTTLGISKPQFNRNIAEMVWSKKQSADAGTIAGYAFTYDKINRLINAQYAAKINNAWNNNGNYNEAAAYDKNTNVTLLTRNAFISGSKQAMDMLTYTYTGNQLAKVEDAIATITVAGFTEKAHTTTEYSYDANGNMVTDQNKGLTVTYNYLNLPQSVTVSGAVITYTYDATGEKLRKAVTIGGSTHTSLYICGLQFTDNVLDFMHTAEGKVMNDPGGWRYEYFLKDHLGNVRMSFDNTGTSNTAKPLQEDGYYPYGLTYYNPGQTLSEARNKYLAQGKELQEEMMMYDFEARFYDQVLIPTPQQDPHAESYPSVSPYSWLMGNPMSSTDPTGMDVVKDGDKYTITGDDIYTYYSYLQNVSDGTGSMDNLNQAMALAAEKNDGQGGTFHATLGEEEHKDPIDPMFARYKNPNFNSNSPQYTAFSEGGELAVTGLSLLFAGEGLLELGYKGLTYVTGRLLAREAAKGGEAIITRSVGAAAKGSLELTAGGRKVLGNLINLKDITLRNGVISRGGKAGNLNVIASWLHDMPIGQIANLAAKGESEAVTAIKILKQAASKAQKY